MSFEGRENHPYYKYGLVQSQVGGPNWAWAGPAGRALSILLVQFWCLAFLKICLKIHFCTSYTLRALPVSSAQTRIGLCTWRWSDIVCTMYILPKPTNILKICFIYSLIISVHFISKYSTNRNGWKWEMSSILHADCCSLGFLNVFCHTLDCLPNYKT